MARPRRSRESRDRRSISRRRCTTRSHCGRRTYDCARLRAGESDERHSEARSGPGLLSALATTASTRSGRDRPTLVREAFNSPFWPFVLATTSVGQEGLDFHLYCHAVVHWNLPANPVDLEQREGRVHRYKGHAIRKNLAAAYPRAAYASDDDDPWEVLFAEGARHRSATENDLVPSWIFTAGPARDRTPCPDASVQSRRSSASRAEAEPRCLPARLSVSRVRKT